MNTKSNRDPQPTPPRTGRGQFAGEGQCVGDGLFTDLYELTMAQAYLAEGMDQTAVFELFFRELPPKRKFIVAAGLSDALDYLEQLHFDDDAIDYLRSQELFSASFLDQLRHIRFTGDAWAVPEGTLVFPNEPVLQVIAPIVEAQLAETFLLNQIHFQSVIASKAARVMLAAEDRTVVDFGSRRAHGVDAALKVARACYLVGGAGTSNVRAGKLYGIPVFGTMAHSYIQAHEREQDAFRAFMQQFPHTTLLVDTYDTLQGIDQVIALAKEFGDRFHVRAVRLDSGDLRQLAIETRRRFDAAGLPQIKIFASSGLDEHAVASLLKQGAPIDGFGVGTRMAVSSDLPDLDFAYKLVEYAGVGRTKLSTGKRIYPGRKQVFRCRQDGRLANDVIARHSESFEGEPLLRPVMRKGRRLPDASVPLAAARDHAMRELSQLPGALRAIDEGDESHEVRISDSLRHASTAGHQGSSG